MNKQLRFEKFRVWQVVVPVRRDILAGGEVLGGTYSANLSWPEMPIHLVEGVTTEGFSAIGECGRGTPTEHVEATLRGLLGIDLLAVSPATAWMESKEAIGLPPLHPLWSWQAAANRSYVLFESLWLDAIGKASRLPAHRLLGGAVRKEVAVDFWANRPPPETLLALVNEAVTKGLRGMKLKSDGAGDTTQSLAQIAADLPRDFRFTVDPMCAWRTLRESRRSFERLAQLPCQVQVEDPFPYLNADDWRQARGIEPLTIVCHARDENVLRAGLRDELADAFNLGGASAYEFLRMACVAEFAAKDCWQGSASMLGCRSVSLLITAAGNSREVAS